MTYTPRQMIQGLAESIDYLIKERDEYKRKYEVVKEKLINVSMNNGEWIKYSEELKDLQAITVMESDEWKRKYESVTENDSVLLLIEKLRREIADSQNEVEVCHAITEDLKESVDLFIKDRDYWKRMDESKAIRMGAIAEDRNEWKRKYMTGANNG